MSLESPKSLPIGIGQEKLAEKAKTLSAIPIKNEVLWVNKDMELPFVIKEGEQTDLALFLTPFPPDITKEKSKGQQRLEVHWYNWRSSLLGRVIFKDKEGRLYRDIDQKGSGYVGTDTGELVVNPSLKIGYGYTETAPSGLCNLGYANHDRNISELFLKNGIRTYRTVAIVKLKKILDKNGKKISILAAKLKKYLKFSDIPVIQLRAYGTKMRVENAVDKIHIEDAIKLIAQELGKENMSPREYLEWFIETLGHNIGKMHKLGYVHEYINDNNITLDCRIIDLDSVKAKKKGEFYSWHEKKEKDRRWGISVAKHLASETTRAFGGNFMEDKLYNEVGEIFMRGYEGNLD